MLILGKRNGFVIWRAAQQAPLDEPSRDALWMSHAHILRYDRPPMANDDELFTFLNSEKATLQDMAKGAREKDESGFAAAAGRLLVAGATGIPFLGALAAEGVKSIWAKSSYAQFQQHLSELEAEEDEDARARKYAAFTAALMGEALVGFSEQLRSELASRVQIEALEAKLDGFAAGFHQSLVRAEVQLLDGGAVGAKVGVDGPKSDVELKVERATGKGTAVLDFT